MFVNTSLCFRSRNGGRAKRKFYIVCGELLEFSRFIMCTPLLSYLPHAGGAEVIRRAAGFIVCLSVAPQPPNLGSFYEDLIGKMEIGRQESIVFQIYLALLGDYIQFTTEFLVVTTVLMLQASSLLAQSHKWWASCTTPL